MLAPGTLVDGRYEIVSRLGSGGMADVYCARDTQLGRNVALKLLHPHFAEDQEFVERFRREASSAAGLSHPNVVSIFDRGEWNDTYYIAMEYIEGRTLKSVIAERGALDPASAVEIVLQVLRAARFAHRRGVIHRDIKPHNVLLDEEGRAKVTDFGIARAGASDMTQTGSIIGTVQYLSPEQAQGHAVSAASDLYAIGIVLFELLTGHVPFDGESAVSIALQQVTADPVPPSSINPAVPAPLDAVVLHALAKDPAARYTDADAFIAALEEVRAAGYVDLGATASFEPAAALAAGGVAAAVAPPPVAQQVYGPEPGPAEPGTAAGGPPSGRRRQALLAALGGVVLLAIVGLVLVLVLHKQKVVVPSVVGQQQSAAVDSLLSAGLRPMSQTVIDSVPAGQVIHESPAAGVRVKKNTLVTLTVSQGPGSAGVPDVAGQTEAKAEQAMKAAGFLYTVQPLASATVAAGKVVGTTPPASVAVQLGSTVSIDVSTGPSSLTVVPVVGDQLVGARELLQSEGFTVNVVQQPSSQAAGIVLSQSPSGGASAHQGSTVTLTVAKAEPMISVPDVVGRGPFRAGQVLDQAGLTESITHQATTVPSQNDHVISQTPIAGSKAKSGSAVTIVVGSYAPTPTTSTAATTTTGTTTGAASTTTGTTTTAPSTPPAAP
ncbi:MAG TPA: Stk1 family PASTA domain-containing Ser/Thr kinase [Solirubrobacteraceae bacterium]|jgi:serine/threonine-protein kinase|nr:Stk1 family PASTA domain-containing Ser/Thr kinase [Solirubrobacteraceae bacterium]